MDFFAIADQFEEDVYYDLRSRCYDHGLDEGCLLPSRCLAEEIIEDELGSEAVIVEITIDTLSRDGVWSWERSRVPRWDGWMDEDE